jgi:uncharacterized protein (TIGR02996 family)
MSPDEEALLRAICVHPDDDAPRLVYADWLEERGEPAAGARAEFIRLQVRLHSLTADDRVARTFEQRAWQLLHDYNPTWLAPMGMNLWGVRYRRGFIEEARTRSNILLAHAPWFALYPIRSLDCEADDDTAVELTRILRARGRIRTNYLARLGEFNALPCEVQRQRLSEAGGRLAAVAGLEAFGRLWSFRWSVPAYLYRRWAGR